jgi:hypothetical protein
MSTLIVSVLRKDRGDWPNARLLVHNDGAHNFDKWIYELKTELFSG